MEKQYGVKLSHFMLTEAILSCRGTELDSSDPKNRYDLDKLIEWIMKNLPSLYSFNTLKSFRERQKPIARQTEKDKDEYYHNRFISPTNRQYQGDMDEWFTS